jgi:hypothetical protein
MWSSRHTSTMNFILLPYEVRIAKFSLTVAVLRTLKIISAISIGLQPG